MIYTNILMVCSPHQQQPTNRYHIQFRHSTTFTTIITTTIKSYYIVYEYLHLKLGGPYDSQSVIKIFKC